MVGDHGRAEDITQEVFISALRRMRATDRPIAFKPWVYEIAKNACIDEFRRTRRTKEVSLDTDDDGEGHAPTLVSRGPTPDTALERRQQLDDLRGAFRGLSDNHHKILVLRELEGLSYTEIGRRMGMTRPVVESTLFRARRRLGQEYEEIASGQRCAQVHAVVDAGGLKAVRALGVREHRRLARHVAHCQPCRRYAWAAGVDESVLKPRSVAQKIAALLPIPAFLRWRRHGGDSDPSGASGSHSSLMPLQTASQTVSQLAGPGSPAAGLGRVAAAVAAVAVAGGGVVAGITSQQASKPSSHSLIATKSTGPSSAGSQPGVARTHRTLAPSTARTAKSKSSAKSTATTQSTSSSGGSTTSTSSTTGTTASSQPVAHTGLTSSGTSTAGSTTSKAGSLLQSATSTLSKPRLPALPKVDLGSVSSTVNNLTQTVSSTVNNTVGTLTNTLSGR
jgi:RNA polymerase sigma factor (sigma-70 family)